MLARTTCNHTVASSSLAFVTFVLFFWQGRLVLMPMNAASRGLSIHSKRPHLSGCVSAGNLLSVFYWILCQERCVAKGNAKAGVGASPLPERRMR